MKLSATPTASLIACLVVLAASANAERMTPKLATSGQFLRTNHDEPLGNIYTEDSDDEDDYFADDLEEYEDGRDDEQQPWITYPNAMRDGPKFVWADEAELEDENDFYGYGPKYMDLEEYLDDEEESYSYGDTEESFDDDEESDSEENIPAGPMFKFPKFVKRGDGPDDDNDFYRYGQKYIDAEESSYSEDEEDIDSGEDYAYEYDFDSEDEDEEEDLDMYDMEEEFGLYSEDLLDGEDEPDMYEVEFLDDEDELDTYEEELLDDEDELDTYEEELLDDEYEEKSLDEDEPDVNEEASLDEDEPDVNEEEPDDEVEPDANEEEPGDEVDFNGKDEVLVNRMKMMATAPHSTPTPDKSARFGSIVLFAAIGTVGLVITGATVYAVRKRKREGEPAISRDDEDRSQNELRFSTSTFGDAHDEEIGVPASRFATDYGI